MSQLLLTFMVVVFAVFTGFLLVLLQRKNKTIYELNKKLSNTISLINERLALADKYSKTLAEVADKTFEAVIITDKEGNIEWVNAGFTNITGYSFHEVKGKKPGQVLQGPETDPFTVERIREKLREKKIFKEEILNYHKQGHAYWLSLSITPLLDANGNVEKFIAIESDITLQKKERIELENRLKVLSEQNAAGV